MKKEIKISSDKIGNIFFENNPVKFTFCFKKLRGKAELRVKSIDWDRKISMKIKDKWTGSPTEINFGKQSLGYYLILAQVVKENRVVVSGQTSYGVIINPKKRKVIADSLFALDAAARRFFKSKEVLIKVLKLVNFTGISCVRDRFSWSEIEPRKGKFKWRWYDISAKIQNQLGLAISQVFHDAPYWASGNKDERYPPKNPEDIREFFYRMTSHFKKTVRYWEVWNEPDIKTFYLGKPEQYAALLKEAYHGIKKGNPYAKVLLCSFAKAPGKFAQSIFKQKIADFFDIYNVHYYGKPEGIKSILNKHRTLMKRFNIQKPIWITEMGAKHPENKINEKILRKEAIYLVKSYIYALANGVDRLFYFIFFDYTASEWKNYNFGIFNRDFTPRPAYVTLCNLTHLLGKGKYLGHGNIKGTNVQSFMFSDGKKKIVVIWTKKRQKAVLNLKLPIIEVVDVIGQNIPCKRVNSKKFSLTVTTEPVFIKIKKRGD